FWTTDAFLRLTYGTDRWQTSTRVVYSSSPNEYSYRNHDKKENIYDDEHNIIGSYYPREKHDDGAFRDFHLLQEAYYNTGNGDRFGLNAWLIASKRGLGRMTTDYGDPKKFINEQRERTLRSVLSWDHLRRNWKVAAKAGYIYSWFAYDYANDVGNGKLEYMTNSRNWYHTLFVSGEGEYYIGHKWLFTAQADLHQHFVTNNDRRIISQDMNRKTIGYNHARTELSTSITAKWMPTERLGLSVTLREEMYGAQWTPLIPAFYADYLISKRGTIRAKASVSRNYRFPSLNDLYFLPGGNPDLKKEHGFTYDAGLSFAVGKEGVYSLSGEATWFDSYIDDWIVWLPTFKGFWTPMNIKEVHAYGVELKGDLNVQLARNWQLGIDGTFSWTPSINHGDPVDWADEAIGKQLVYVPEYSAAVTGRLAYKSWRFLYKWCYYSERFTTSNNDVKTKIGRVLPYFMSDVSLEKLFSFRWGDFSVKVAVKNLLDEEYETVLSRPMPRMNYEIFLDIRPKWGKKKARD
ncbi:TonB-dependent receptor, partial [Proteus mirabilis]|nr:TonB-dependent receptor [Proteus mirabilis]